MISFLLIICIMRCVIACKRKHSEDEPREIKPRTRDPTKIILNLGGQSETVDNFLGQPDFVASLPSHEEWSGGALLDNQLLLRQLSEEFFKILRSSNCHLIDTLFKLKLLE